MGVALRSYGNRSLTSCTHDCRTSA